MRALLCLAALGLSACGDNDVYPFVGLTRVTGESPFPPDCNGAPQRGTNYRGAEVEPFIAVDPAQPSHLIGVWQQDRWSNGGSNGDLAATSFDGGATWTVASARFSRCAGGNAGNGGDYERASDPWVTISPDGTAYQIALAFDGTTARNAILASRSTDGGRSWSDAATLIFDDNPDVFNDKESITADAIDPHTVYAVWDRTTGNTQPTMPIGTGPAYFARARDGVWEPARAIYDPGADNQTLGNQIVVLPDGTLIDLFNELRNLTGDASAKIRVMRSTDQGDTWSEPIDVAPIEAVGVFDARNKVGVRSGADLPEIAVDRSTGALYVVWEEGSFSQGARDAIAMAQSFDGGLTWVMLVPPAPINQAPDFPAFLPSIAILDDGTLGVSYYDLRNDDPDDDELLATVWLITSRDGGATWHEQALTDPFDLRIALFGGAYFVGDYQGMAPVGGTFMPFFAAALKEGNPTEIFTRAATP